MSMRNVHQWWTLLLNICVLGMFHKELCDTTENTEGEIFDSHFHLIFCLLDDESENLAFNIGIVNGGVRFVKVKLASDKAVSGFGRGLEIFSTFGLPTIQQAGFLVLVIVE